MNQSSFKDRFSLDFLTPSDAPSSQRPSDTQLPRGLEAVLDSYSGQLLSTMKAAPDQTIDLLELAKTSSTRLETVLPVVQHLANKGLIERVREDPSGNDTYKVTPAGQDAKI